MGTPKENSLHDSRNEGQCKKQPQKLYVLDFEKELGSRRSKGIADKKSGQGPGGFIQFHSKFRNQGPSERQMQKETANGMRHVMQAVHKGGPDVTNIFRQAGHSGELKDHGHKHKDGADKVKPIEFCNAAKHEGHHGDTTVGIAELGGK